VKTLAFVLGLCISPVGAVGVLVPSSVVSLAQRSMTSGAFYVILILGIATTLTGLVAIGQARGAIEWWSQQGSGLVRLTCVLLMALGGFVAYACAPARRAEDLEAMSREQLITEARRLRAGIWAQRDSTGHALCWHHPALWGLLPEKTDPLLTVPTCPEFLQGCLKYRQSLDEQLPDAHRSDAPYQS
jgi:hypothetical protein